MAIVKSHSKIVMNNKEPVPALKIFQLSVNYEKTPVLWDISLEVPPGHLIGIIGPNGAGKSTLIKAALELIKPLSGRVEFFDKPLSEVRQRVAYVPQRETVDWDFPITVQDLVLMGRYGHLGLFRRPTKDDIAIARHYLERVSMLEFAHRQISQLSGGQQQRVFLARALAQEADIYFMDEPFAAIDHSTEIVIMELLRELKNSGKTVFVVHHDLNTVESYYDWLIILNMRLIACGKVPTVFNSHNLMQAYGKNNLLLNEVFKLSQNTTAGLI